MKNIKLFEEFINELKNVNAEDIKNLLDTYFVLYKGHFYFFDSSTDNFIETFQNFLKDNNLPQVDYSFDDVTNYLENGFIGNIDYISGNFTKNYFNKNIPKDAIILEIFLKEFNDVRYSDEINKILKHFNTLNYIEINDVVYTREELLKFKFNTDFKLGEFVYHGTSLDNIESILKYGLKPKSGTSFFKDMSDDLVHITTSFNMAKYYSKLNILKDYNFKNKPIILEISTNSLNKNLIDYDYKFYQKYIENDGIDVNINKTSNLNKFGYKGIIYPSKINRIFVADGYGNDKWVEYNSLEEIKKII
jgi:hypothetical protein